MHELSTTQSSTQIPTTMTAAVAHRYGQPDVISIDKIPVPTPTDNELLVRVAFTSLNALDWHFLTGTPLFLRLVAGLRRPKRNVPGADVAGHVVAVGPNVSDFQPGDAIFGECSGGGCGEYLTVDANSVALKPTEVSFETAGATPVAALTALQALRTHGATQSSDRVLINGAAGGVGTFAVQIAKAMGAEVTAVCSTNNVDMIRSLGADEVIDYHKDDFTQTGSTFNVMIDIVGNRSAKECLKMLTPDARCVAVSGPKDNRLLGPVAHIARSALVFSRAKPSFHQFTASPNRADLDYLGNLLATGQIVPQIDRVIGLDQVAAGLAEIGTGHTKAKIVVTPQHLSREN